MKNKTKLSREVAIVGAGMSKFGVFKDKDSKDLYTEAFNEMLLSVDKGFNPKDIDAIYIGNYSNDFFVNQAHWGPIFADLIGHVPKPATRIEGACASSSLALREGVFAIASGFYDIVLVSGVEEMSKRSIAEATEGLAMAGFSDEAKHGFTFPGLYAARAVAYFEKYGATQEDLMEVTIKSHNNGCFNQKAQFSMSIRDIMNAKIERAKTKGEPIPTWRNEKEMLRDTVANPVIAWPLHLFDCCPISDGASCILLVASEIAKSFTDKPLQVIGIGQGSGTSLCNSEDLTSLEGVRYAAKESYEMSGLKPEDIQFAEVHDCFSIAEIIAIEDLGFFNPGEGYKAVNEGLTRLDGSKPINTSGGLKCKGHPVGATGMAQIYEVWKQLRGEAGKRQITNPNLRIGATHNVGGHGGTCTFTILERR